MNYKFWVSSPKTRFVFDMIRGGGDTIVALGVRECLSKLAET